MTSHSGDHTGSTRLPDLGQRGAVVFRDHTGRIYEAVSVQVSDGYGFGEIGVNARDFVPISDDEAIDKLGLLVGPAAAISEHSVELTKTKDALMSVERELSETKAALTLNRHEVAAGDDRAIKLQRIINTLQETETMATLPNPSPPTPNLGLMSVFSDAGKIAAGATVLAIVSQFVAEKAKSAGMTTAAVDHPFFKAVVKLAAPTVLRAIAQRVPHLQNVAAIDQILRIAQVSAVASVAQDTIDAIFDHVGPMFTAIGAQAVKAEQLDQGAE